TGRQAAIDDNRVCIDQAREIGAEMIVLVVGAVPGIPLDVARGQVLESLAAIAPAAAAAGVRLAVEPLHPMYAADKSCLNRISDVRHLLDQLDSPSLGIAIDVYHTWWDPDMESEV